MNARKKLLEHLMMLHQNRDLSGINFSHPVETEEGRFSLICCVAEPDKSFCKIVCKVIDENKIGVNFLPLHKINETGGYVPVPTNVKDIYSQYFQPIQVQTMMANDRMMVG